MNPLPQGATPGTEPPTADGVMRERIHLRRISCEGFRRSDGLFDIDGTLIDTKPVPLALPERFIASGEAIHHMTLRMTVDRQWIIRDLQARTVDGPYVACGLVAARYAQLIGIKIEPGFTRTVKRLFKGVLGCTHMTELLPPMATTAFQMLWGEPEGFGAADKPETRQRSSPLNGCYVLRLDGDVVKQHFQHLTD
jgi:Protein of unknown function (DUF2889)